LRLSRQKYTEPNAQAQCERYNLWSSTPAKPQTVRPILKFSPMPILRTHNLVKRFGPVTALNGVSFDLREGEIHSLCGENGAGKSTLIKTLSGIHAHGSYEGDILVDEKPMRFRNIADAEAAGICVIYQELALIDHMTVAENIFLGREPVKHGLIDHLAMLVETRKLLDRFEINIAPETITGELGVGHQQLIEIVKALAKNSRVLILDEPTAALSENEVAILLATLKDLRSRGVTCVYISHKLDEVFAMSDRITVLRDGKSITTLDAKSTDKSEVIRHMVGREINDLFPRRATMPGKVRLSVRGVSTSRTTDGKPIHRDVSFDVHAGEVLGIGGLMGAGRTELLMHIFGAWGRRTGGSVSLDGVAFDDSSTPSDAIQAGLVLVSEDRKRYGLILEENIGFNLSLSSLRQLTAVLLIDKGREFRENQSLFSSLRVKAPSLEAIVGRLSGGNQQKVVIGKALMTKPKVVFLDEPTRGIDVGAKLEVYELINALTARGVAVVLVSSELPELMGMSDRIFMLHGGEIAGRFTRAQATQETLLAAALGHAAAV
jgi:D-xylose transport system ATP-binding protein